MSTHGQPDRRLPIAVLLSGSGRTLENLIRLVDEGRLPVELRCAVTSHAGARGRQIAETAGIPCRVMRRAEYRDPEEFSAAIFGFCRDQGVELVAMAGFIHHVLIPADFQLRVVNIHPSLIPAFAGKGYYGERVHRAVAEHGCKISGCTVHFVDNQYDHGPIILQRAVEIDASDSPEQIAAKVFAEECRLYPDVLTAIAEGRVAVDGRRVHVSP